MLRDTRLPRCLAGEAAGAPNILSDSHYAFPTLPHKNSTHSPHPLLGPPSTNALSPALPLSQPPTQLLPPPLLSYVRRRRWRGGPKADLAQPPAHARAEATTQGPKLAYSALARTTTSALSKKAACATFNARAAANAHAPKTSQAPHFHRNRSQNFLSSACAASTPSHLLFQPASNTASAPSSRPAAPPPLANKAHPAAAAAAGFKVQGLGFRVQGSRASMALVWIWFGCRFSFLFSWFWFSFCWLTKCKV